MMLPRLFLGTLLVSMGASAHASPACHTELSRHDRAELRCPWPAGAPALRFDAHFAGSHDDTEATLGASVNGTPLACAAGSKTSIDSSRDEGDVTLSCRLTAPSAAPPNSASAELRIALRWYHARYTGFELRVESAP